MTNKDQIKAIAWEFKWDEKKLIEKLADEKMPEFAHREEFKEKLDTKIQNQINITKKQRIEQAVMDSVPKKLKWRFYLTWYWYAVVSFFALFLIWFCTNIFTGTLKVPTKYTYLEEKNAFWNIENWELTYNYNTDKASNFYYNDNINNDEYDEVLEESTSDKIDTRSTKVTMEAFSQSMGALDSDIYSTNYLLNKGFMFNETYRFAYKDKIFPKLAVEYPVLKSNWILMWSNTPNQVLKNLKIWWVSFKKFQDLEIAGLYIEQKTENWYTISYESHSQTLNFYPNNNRQAQEFKGKIPSNKQIIKNIEKELKQLGITTKNYGNAEINTENYDETMWIINVFYPFYIEWKEVRNWESAEKIWMQIAYDLNLQKIVSIIWMDISTYEISNYPTSDRSYIENEIENWWEFFNQWALHENSTVVLFDNMQIVYIPKYENWTTYYVPAIKWEVKTSLESYKWPKYVFQEIVQ